MFSSVRVRLTLWYSLFLAIALVAVAAATYWVVRKNVRERTDEGLRELADSFIVTFEDELNDADNKSDLVSAAKQAMIEHRYPNHAFAILSPSGEILTNSLELPQSGLRTRGNFERISLSSIELCKETLPKLDKGFATAGSGRQSSRCYVYQFAAAGQNNYLLLIAASLHSEHETLERIRLAFAWLIPFALVLAATGGYFLARKSLAPAVAMGSQANRISANNLHERLQVHNPDDELGQLAGTLNQLLDRLSVSFERQRQFIADASHELRTPVAILRGEAEVTLSQSSRPAEEYRESLTILHQEAKRLTRIVEDLFTLTRADAGQYPLSPRDFYLDELVNDCAHSVRSLALTKGISLVLDVQHELLLRADEDLIRRMTLNLLDNAIKYTPSGGRVTVSCQADSSQRKIVVADTGLGIPPELQSRVFERFFRADPARSRLSQNGGAGLGLSIARWIAEVHHGRLELTRSDASGSVFTAVLPSPCEPPSQPR